MANDILDDEVDPIIEARNTHFAQLEQDALRYTLQTRHGRRLMWSILGKCGFSHQPFVPGHPDVTAFNNGKQDVAINLISDMDAVMPDAFHLMAKESKEDRDIYDRRSNSSSPDDNGSSGITSNSSSDNSLAIINGSEQ